jgi:molecular chaperone DnaJ
VANKRDYYDILGVSKNASTDEIKRAYRKLARTHHPDVSKEENAEEKFKEITEAYRVLSDDEKRAKYDRFGHSGMNQQGGGADFSGFGGFEDIFDMMFNGGFGRRNTYSGPEKGSDLRYDLTLTLEEAVFGTEKEITIQRYETCDRCDGSGAEPGSKVETCPVCNGSGQVRRGQQTPFGQFVNVTTCDNCGGTGKIVEEKCHQCRGSGKTLERRKIEVKIPPGVDNGTRLRVAGKGEAGDKGGPYGDLYIYIRVKSHPTIDRKNDHLYTKNKISFIQAAIGAEIPIETLDGTVKLKIPHGTQPNTTFRIEDRGVPRGSRGSRGDFFVTVQIEVPKKLNDQQLKALSEFAKASGEEFDPPDKSFVDRIKDIFK